MRLPVEWAALFALAEPGAGGPSSFLLPGVLAGMRGPRQVRGQDSGPVSLHPQRQPPLDPRAQLAPAARTDPGTAGGGRPRKDADTPGPPYPPRTLAAASCPSQGCEGSLSSCSWHMRLHLPI